MNTVDLITELFIKVDDEIDDNKHPQTSLYPSEVVTLAMLYALKGCGQLRYWRWLTGNYSYLFHELPNRTRLFRLFNSHRHYIEHFLAEPSLVGVIDSYGIELLHPIREGRSDKQIGKKGKSNKRWIVGGKLCYLLNHLGLVVDWSCDTANVYDGSAFQHIVDNVSDKMVVFSDTGFEKADWHPTNLRICKRGEWNVRMLVETVFSMLTYVCDFKHSRHKSWDYFETKVGFTMALFNVLAQWYGLQPDEAGFVPLSIAEFSL
jgi:hypothetical protein